MTVETQTQAYQFKGTPIIRGVVPKVGNLRFDERGKEVLAIHNQRFRGLNRIADTHDYKEGEPLSFSNLPRVLSYAQILRERFPDMYVLTPEEVVKYWDFLPERDSTYADTDATVVYPNQGSNEDLRKQIFGMLGRLETKVPLVVSGLGVERANSGHGFKFIEIEPGSINAKEAQYLERDGRVAYDSKEGLVASEEGVNIWTPFNQSGLRRLYRYRSGELIAGYDSLLGSDGAGRVQVLYAPLGRAENLDHLTRQLQEEGDRLKAGIDARLPGALEYLRTGKFLQ